MLSLFEYLNAFSSQRARRRAFRNRRYDIECCERRLLLAAPQFQDPVSSNWSEDPDIGFSVDEGESLVGTIQVRDTDFDLMTVDINDQTGHFYIMPVGSDRYEIRVFESNPLDFEALDPNDPTLTFSITAMDGMLNMSTANVTVTVNDVGPVFSAASYEFDADVGHDAWVPIGSISASSTSPVTYSIVSNSGPYQDANKFTIDTVSGAITPIQDILFDNPVPGTPDEAIIPAVEHMFLAMAADDDGETKTVPVKVTPKDAQFLVDNVFSIVRSSRPGHVVARGRLDYVNKWIAETGNQVTYEIVNIQPPGGNNPNLIPKNAFKIVTTGYESTKAERFEIRIDFRSKIDFTWNSYTIKLRAKFRSAEMVRRQNLMNPPKRIYQDLGTQDIVVPIRADLDHVLPTDKIRVLDTLRITPEMLAAAGAQTLPQIADEVDRQIDAKLARIFDNSNTANSGYHIVGADNVRERTAGPNSTESVTAVNFGANTAGKSGVAVVWNVRAKRTADQQNYDFSDVEVVVLPWTVIIDNENDRNEIRYAYAGKVATVPGPRDTTDHEDKHLEGLDVMNTFQRQLTKQLQSRVNIPFAKRKIGMAEAARIAVKVIERQLAHAIPDANDTSDAEATARAMDIINRNLTGLIPDLVFEGTWHLPQIQGVNYYMFNDSPGDPFAPWNRPQ